MTQLTPLNVGEPLTACVAHSHGLDRREQRRTGRVRMKPLCFKHHEGGFTPDAKGECLYCGRPMPEANRD